MQVLCLKPIGVIHSPHHEPRGTPIQASAALGIEGRVEVWPEYVPGLQDLDGFSHLILTYHFHRARGAALKVRPFLDDAEHGVFATRAPARPNPIGISVVRLVQIEDNMLRIQDVDILDGTPLLDIKPYVPAFDVRPACTSGWLEDKVSGLANVVDDARFATDS